MSSIRINNILGHLAPAVAQAVPVSANATSAHQRKPKVVLVTGAAGNIAYSLIFQLAHGLMLGKDQPIELRLLDIPQMVDKLKGVEMEVLDCAFPLITKIVCTADYAVAFKDVDIALLVGAKPRGPGMDRADLLTQNAAIFSGQGKALNKYASRNVKVVVVGNPANTNALIAMTNAPDLPRENFTALTRLDQNRAVAQIALKAGVPVKSVRNVIIWGNHSNTQYPDVNHAIVLDKTNRARRVREVVKDKKWLEKDFIPTVQLRGGAIIKARKLSSAASAANAVVDHIRDWVVGTPKGTYVSMAIPSDGSYGVPKGIVYSFPVTCSNGKYKIVQGLKIDDASRKRMDDSAKELLDERKAALKE